MRDALVITLTLIIAFVILGYAYNLISPYLAKLGVIDSPGRVIVAKSDGGIFRSEDFGRTWAQANETIDGEGISKDNVFALKFSPKDTRMIYAAVSSGLFVSSDSGSKWRNILDSAVVLKDEAVEAFVLDPKSPERMYISVAAPNKISRILKTKGAGFYEVYSTAVSENKVTGLWIDSFDPSVLYAGTTKGLLLISKDFGESWRVLKEFAGAIYDLEMVPSDTRILYLAADGLIFKSVNQGVSFEQIWQAVPTLTSINDLAIDFNNESTIYAATSRGLYQSVNGGKLFGQIKLPIGSESPNVNTVYVPKEGRGLLMLGVDSYFYKSEDFGGTWQIKQLNTSRKVSEIISKPDDSRVVFIGVTQN